MKIALGALLALTVVLALLLIGQVAQSGQQRSQIAELALKLQETSAHEAFELQARCAAQADRFFHQMGYRLNDPNAAAFFQSHYSPKHKKCFMALESTLMGRGLSSTSYGLFDAYERRVYAEYFWTPDKEKKFWEVPPKICKLTPPSQIESTCASEQEYRAFVSAYMD